MPVVQTLNKCDESIVHPGKSSVNDLVEKITFDILREIPQLVVEVESGNLDKRMLEKEIIRNIDKNKYFLGSSREELIRKVFDYMFGYWDLEQYIQDESISDIDGIRYDYFTVKRNGIKEEIPLKFSTEQQFDSFCKLVAIRNGGILNENDSHCRVTDEKNRLRINVSIRPRNITGPAINIRKHPKESPGLKELEQQGMMDGRLRAFFEELACSSANIVFCGKGAAGKTTLLRALSKSFDSKERVLVCESDSEIYPDNPNFIVQRIKKNNEGGKAITLRDLVKDGLTMSLDTYIIGEIVGDEAWEFVKAGLTGHRILATTHSQSSEDVFDRLITLIKSANVDHTEKTLRRMLASSIDVVVLLKKFKVVEVIEVIGYDEHKDTINTACLFGFNILEEDEERISGEFVQHGEISGKLRKKMMKKG